MWVVAADGVADTLSTNTASSSSKLQAWRNPAQGPQNDPSSRVWRVRYGRRDDQARIEEALSRVLLRSQGKSAKILDLSDFHAATRGCNPARLSPPNPRALRRCPYYGTYGGLRGRQIAARMPFDRRSLGRRLLRLIFAEIAPADTPGVPFDLGQSGVERRMRTLINAGHGFHGVALRVNRELMRCVLHNSPH